MMNGGRVQIKLFGECVPALVLFAASAGRANLVRAMVEDSVCEMQSFG